MAGRPGQADKGHIALATRRDALYDLGTIAEVAHACSPAACATADRAALDRAGIGRDRI
jgi:hypothetical protein